MTITTASLPLPHTHVESLLILTMRINSRKCPYCKSKLIGHLYSSYDPELKETITEITLECKPCSREIDISDYYETLTLKKEQNGSFNRTKRELGTNGQ